MFQNAHIYNQKTAKRTDHTKKGWEGTVEHVEWDLVAHMVNLMAWSILLSINEEETGQSWLRWGRQQIWGSKNASGQLAIAVATLLVTPDHRTIHAGLHPDTAICTALRLPNLIHGEISPKGAATCRSYVIQQIDHHSPARLRLPSPIWRYHCPGHGQVQYSSCNLSMHVTAIIRCIQRPEAGPAEEMPALICVWGMAISSGRPANAIDPADRTIMFSFSPLFSPGKNECCLLCPCLFVVRTNTLLNFIPVFSLFMLLQLTVYFI